MRDKQGNHGEAPITKFWYSRKAGQTIEEIIDTDPQWFIWAVQQFQNVTPQQAAYFEQKYGMELPENVIQDVPPYNPDSGEKYVPFVTNS
jgi:hypothetical protein